MAKAKGLTYEELAMFRTSYEVDREHAAMAAW
jgi:hypothetical protein